MKALFVGLGSIGQRHLRNLRTLMGDDVDIIAWRTRGQNVVVTDTLQVDAAVDIHEHYRFRIAPTLASAFKERPDVTFVCNPSSMHLPVALDAVRAGSHVFIEKPLSDRIDVRS